MSRGVTITNYLANGDPDGIVFSYVSNWTGQAIKIPRNLFTSAKEFPELRKPGVYFLIGQDQENPEKKLIYSGEANNLADRIITHLRSEEKSFCEVIICFSSKDENLTVSHTKYLEEKIISTLSVSRAYSMINGKSGNVVSLPKMVKDEMDTYYDNIKIVLPALGFHILNESKMIPTSEVRDNEFFLDVSNFKAAAKLISGGVLVLKGSTMNPKETPSLSGSYSSMRKMLNDKGIVIQDGEVLRFITDYEFPSPSTAAALILGYSINGRTAWKNKSGKSIKQLEEEQLQNL